MNSEENNNIYFKVFPEFYESYINTIHIGREFIQDKNIIITGLTRNNEDRLENNIKVLQQLNNNNIKYFVYENDSADKTPLILQKLSEEIDTFKYQSEVLNLKHFDQVKDQDRTDKLAKHRNTCLKYIQDNHNNSDYVIVLDFDFATISLDGIYHSFGLLKQHQDVSAVAGFSYIIRGEFLWNYDSWAFRWTWWDDLQKYAEINSLDPMCWFGLFHPPIGSSALKVNSAFGGCCIYKTNTYLNGKYSGEDCEHVIFHKNLYSNSNNKFCLIANPSQIMVL